MEITRVDRWLWAVRIYKTRSLATDACRGGHVAINGVAAKAATNVRAGDRVTTRIGGWERDLEVVAVIDKRVSAPLAATAMSDHSPPPPKSDPVGLFLRDPSAGRPTKRDRRQLDRFRQP